MLNRVDRWGSSRLPSPVPVSFVRGGDLGSGKAFWNLGVWVRVNPNPNGQTLEIRTRAGEHECVRCWRPKMVCW